MSSIKSSMFDTSFVEEFADHLREEHGIGAWLVDSEDVAVPMDRMEVSALPHVRYYPLGEIDGLGGIKCAAESEETLRRADPQIRFGIKGINHLLERDLELQQTSDEMLQLSEQLSFLFKLARKTIGLNEIEGFCKAILEEVVPAIAADYGVVHAKGRGDQETDILHNIDERGLETLREKGIDRIPVKDSTVISSLSDGTSVLHSPIKEKGGSIGYMAFFKSPDKRFFTSYEKKFVSIIEHIISPTVETIRLYGSLQDLYLNTVKALAAAIDAKDEYTHGHSFRVAKFANTIARQLCVPEKTLHDLDIAAYMHDLGKIGVPESILGKPGKLTEAEFLEIKKHPLLTNKILEPIHLPPMIVDAAVQHHERIDGKGYPFGLKGKGISPYARIIAVADVFDALTSKRPYRDAMTVEKALGILCQGIDVEFDREAVQAIVSALQNKGIEREWAEILPDLRFADVQHLGRFLCELSEIIHTTPQAGSPPQAAEKEETTLA
ncbi:MAG: HD-GYP domain-containing protein [Deltaproteobacteria bacterium]|nr:HD-GYP domain-containing protein [Deltaproteobacteria bacterium]